jgi:hypothetical protein
MTACPGRIGLLAALALVLAGCDLQQDQTRLRDELAKSNAALNEARNENKRLGEHVARQDERILSLMALGDKRLDQLFHVTNISLGDYTGGVSTDGKDGHNAVKVYLLPMDQDGSIIKATGSVKIQLFDLAAPGDQNLIGQCEFPIEEVRKHWSGGFMTYHYSFVCPWKEGARPHEDVTIRVEFVDYLTGKHLVTQKVVKVKPTTPTQPATQAPTSSTLEKPATTTAPASTPTKSAD